ncbi:major facilitator superfamily domain-containing protein [Zopfochytrium polystomum]|nr:major facilitator superfamily domain-containing protein [Zopfochytrium polystomum]
MPNLKELVINHYREVKQKRSPEQLENEKWLIPGVKFIPFNRWFLLVAAVMIQICCGSLYAWSGYNVPIENAIYGGNGGVSRAIAVNTFYIAVAIFGSAAAILGPWLERNGPFRGAMLGASLFFFGNLVTALGVYVKQISVVYIGYGLFGGAGLGVAYISPVSPLQKWFPELRGLAAGFAVCGFGAGSIIGPYTQNALIGNNYSKDPVNGAYLGVPLSFVILGSCYFIIMSIGAVVLRMPPPGYSVKGITIDTVKGAEIIETTTVEQEKTTTEFLVVEGQTKTEDVAIRVEDDKKPQFSMTLMESLLSTEMKLMYLMFIGSQITGLLIISSIQNIVATQFDRPDQKVPMNSVLGVSNLLGRLILPLTSDLLGTRKPLFILSCVAQAVLLGLLPTTIWNQSYNLFLFCANMIAFFYGGGFGIIPAFLADQFGSKNIGPTHGVILTAWALAGVAGGLTFTAVYDKNYQATYNTTAKAWVPPEAKYHVYDTNFRWILGFVLAGVILASMVPSNLRDRRLPKKEGESFRFRLGSRLVRVYGWVRPVIVPKPEEDAEWNEYLASLNVAENR